MEVGQGPNWGCSAKEKKDRRKWRRDLYERVRVLLWRWILGKYV
jgi:hypothetical protein